MNKLSTLFVIFSLLIIGCSPSEPEDCMGAEGGDAIIDCAGVCGGSAELNVCGNCNTSNDICSFFQLLDLNTSSPSYGSLVGPQTYSGEIRLFYFSDNET